MKRQENILVVAREPEWQAFVMQALRQAGYNAYQANDKASALRVIAGDQPDLIIVDAILADLLKTLAWQYIDNRLLVVTATPSVAEAVSAYRYGALDYVSKTFDIASLLGAVTAALQKQPVQQRLLV
ncbi:MAG: response regulator [Anaerolineales bacterium]|nr:response regulator [Anaerolineales bacterium]